MPFVELRGLRFYFERAGQGAPLLVFNGTGGDLRRKPGIFQSPLPSRFELLCHDQRGLGQSARPDEVYTMEGYADDAAALLDQAGWSRCGVL
jgi:3-oxoadipate enol-lactonase